MIAIAVVLRVKLVELAKNLEKIGSKQPLKNNIESGKGIVAPPKERS